MQQLTSEQHIIIHHQKEVPTAALLLESFGTQNGIPSVRVHQFNLTLAELLHSILKHGFDEDMTTKVNIQLKLYNHGRFCIKISYRGVTFNPFEHTLAGHNRFKNDATIDTLSLHLARKYMDQYTYRCALDHNIVFMSKAQV